MKRILNIYKRAGETPLGAINRLRAANSEYQDVKITYAGRLDPLAEGVLILLAGDAVYEKEKYLKMDKEYKAEILFGFETDTYDILGLPKKERPLLLTSKTVLDVALKNLEREIILPLPPYSSYKIKGKPLFQWAREGKLNEIKIPERKTTVYEIKLLSLKNISNQKLLKKIEQKIDMVKGDFRQKEILKKWQEKMLPNLSDSKNKEAFWTAKIKIKCSSGTYIRSIANDLGKKIKTGGVILSLTRTKVGDFEIKNSLRI